MTLARYQFTVTDAAGNIVPRAKVEVKREAAGRPLAAIKSDRAGTVPLLNPGQADDDGFFGFHVAGGAYQIRAYVGPSNAPTFERKWNYVAIGNLSEFDIEALLSGKRQQVRAATTGNVTISTALNSGDAIDGVTLANGDLVLVKDQTTKAQNGIYVVGAVPARSVEFDTYDEHAGAMVAVVSGTANANAVFLCTANAGGVLNTTAIDFTKLASTAGPPGDPATIEIGEVTTGAPGTDVVIENVGTSTALILNIQIPAGDLGPANSLSIGTVEGGVEASATVTGSAPNQILNLVLPDGPEGAPATIEIGEVTTGAPGSDVVIENVGTSTALILNIQIPAGDLGPANSLSIGTVEGGAEASATLTGSAPNQILNLVLPDGPEGAPATIEIGEVTTGAPGTDVIIENVGTSSALILNIQIPEGAPGAGSGDMLKSVYDPDGNGKIANAQLENLAQATVKGRRAGAGTGAPGDVAFSDLKADMGLANVDNTSDANKPVSTAQQTALDLKQNLSGRGAANGYASLGADGKVPASQMPAIAITDTYEVASQSAMLALSDAEKGDVAIRTDLNKCFILSTNSYGTLADWKELKTPTDVVLSVVGLTGTITQSALKTALALAKADVGLGNVDNTSDMSKPVSTAQAAADAVKSNITRTRRTPTGADTFVIGDAGNVVEMNSATPVAWTVPPNSSVAFPVETQIDLLNYGAGLPTLTAGAGVTIRAADNKMKIAKQFAGATLYKRATDEWVLTGNLTS